MERQQWMLSSLWKLCPPPESPYVGLRPEGTPRSVPTKKLSQRAFTLLVLDTSITGGCEQFPPPSSPPTLILPLHKVAQVAQGQEPPDLLPSPLLPPLLPLSQAVLPALLNVTPDHVCTI